MRSLLFPRYNAYFNLPEAASFKELMQLHFAEPQPMICIQFPGTFESMAQKIENRQPAAAFQNPVGSSDRFLGVNGMMQCLTQNRQIDTVFGNRRILNVAKAVLQILDSMFLCQLRAKLDHLWRIIDGDDFACVFGEQLRKCPLARAKVSDGQWRQQSNQRMRQRFPGAARHVTAAKLARQLVEVFTRLVLTFVQNKLQTGSIA